MFRELKACLGALAFLTRLPLPLLPGKDVLQRSTAYFPLAGLCLGACLALLYFLAQPFFSPLTLAALLLTADFLLTGGLHLDGLMDTADGLLSGRPLPRALEIMRDSRVGAMGVLVAFCLLLFKFSLLAGLNQPGVYRLLLLLPVGARLNLTAAVVLFPYLRQEGLGSVFQEAGWPELLTALTLTALALYLGLDFKGLQAGAATLAAGLVFCLFLSRKLGGLTGDIYGALASLSEVFFLAIVAL